MHSGESARVIYPTRLAVLAAAAGAPVALLIGVLIPGRWYAGLAWPLAALLLTVIDAATGVRRANAKIDARATVAVGETIDATVTVTLEGRDPPRSAEVALLVNPLFATDDDARARVGLRDGKGAVLLALTAFRRGAGRIERVWLRWPGRLGLVWHQRSIATDTRIVILPDIRLLKDKGAEIFRRHAMEGLLTQVDRGDGTDFDALVEYRSGMDRRAIDWKQSARHSKLHAKEYRTERNNQIVFAIDSGRQMSEPVAGVPRIDRAVSAALLTAWVALKLGDRVALHAFDSRPRIASGLVSGMPAFASLQRLAAEIDYSAEETNYTFALTTLATRLTRRSMIVLFTEFTDPTSADFLVRAAMRVVKTHLLLVVVLRDADVEGIADRAPATADDVTRSVTAAALLQDRRLVLARLEHLGVHVIESEHDRVGERLVAGYVALKRRNLL